VENGTSERGLSRKFFAMNLEGSKVKLRIASSEDVEDIFHWENDTDHWLVSDTSVPYSLEQIENFILRDNDIYTSNQTRFMVVSRSNEKAGCVDLFDFDPKNKRVGMGILMDKRFRGQGFGLEAIQLLADYCFEALDVHCVYAEVLETNEASSHIFESCGFLKTGVKKDWLSDGERFVDQLFYQKFRGA
jgi:diamine N-acetyltransferase